MMDFIGKLKEVKEKFDNINEQLSDEENLSNQDKLIKLSKERSELSEIVDAYEGYMVIVNNINGNQEVITAGEDEELVEMAKEELEELRENKRQFEEKIKTMLIPKDPDDDKDVIVEVRA